MSKGENIFKRKDGRWEARYIKGRDLSGKVKYGFCYGRTYKEAKEKAEKCRAALINGRTLPSGRSRRRFKEFCWEWLELRRGSLKESTYVKYVTIIKKHITPKLGECQPLLLSTDIIDEFMRSLLFEDELSPKTVHDILVVLHGIIKYTAGKYPGVFPEIDITYPKLSRREMRVLSRDEQERFMEYLLAGLNPCKFGILLSLFTGIRIGELCALRWSNISLAEGTVRISETLQRLHDMTATTEPRTRIIIGTPKSDCSARIIPLTEYALELCRSMNPEISEAYVLTGTESYMEPRTLQYRLEKYTRDCDLNGVHFHTLRHTFATRAVEVGFELKSLSEILGHATTSITLERYVHSSLELKRDNMRKLCALGM